MAPEIEISRATVDDAAVVTGLQIDFDTEFEGSATSFEVLSARFRRLLADPAAFVLLAGDRADPVGYALVTLRPTVYCEGPLAVLDELYVRPSRRSQGIGHLLLSLVVEEVRGRRGELHINVDEVDVDARRFYERHGFVNIEPGHDYRMLLYVGTSDDR